MVDKEFISRALGDAAKEVCRSIGISESRLAEVTVDESGLAEKCIIDFVFRPELPSGDQVKFDIALKRFFADKGMANSLTRLPMA